MQFDKVIVLSEGRMIYCGCPGEIRNYFEQAPFCFMMGIYSNPADKLLTLATNPRRCIKQSKRALKKGTTPLAYLEAHCKKRIL